MKKRKITYCYLMERKSDGKKFVTFGNFREAWNKPCQPVRFCNENVSLSTRNTVRFVRTHLKRFTL